MFRTGRNRQRPSDETLLGVIIADLAGTAGRRYPARRLTQNIADVFPIQPANFSLGHVTLDPKGGQVPSHNQEQEEIYVVFEGIVAICLRDSAQSQYTGNA